MSDVAGLCGAGVLPAFLGFGGSVGLLGWKPGTCLVADRL